MWLNRAQERAVYLLIEDPRLLGEGEIRTLGVLNAALRRRDVERRHFDQQSIRAGLLPASQPSPGESS